MRPRCRRALGGVAIGTDATRRATAVDVAREAGVARATAGFVLNRTAWRTTSESTRDRVSVLDDEPAGCQDRRPQHLDVLLPGRRTDDVIGDQPCHAPHRLRDHVLLAEPLPRMAKVVADHIGASAPGESDVEVLYGAMTALARLTIDNRDPLVALRPVAERSHHILAAYLGRPEHEQEIAGLLVGRHPGADPDEWSRRLLVACTVAAFRVWLEDCFRGRFADPVDRLRTILDAVFSTARSDAGAREGQAMKVIPPSAPIAWPLM
ncbi:hypothetical protein ACQEWB_20885 [Streptomyces sp. CA-249302]|uniref:hypothetical protein n=1 Tax=Streptomyces sp. CA-249302 TaxID=3240058 RepID=UPI003D90140C